MSAMKDDVEDHMRRFHQFDGNCDRDRGARVERESLDNRWRRDGDGLHCGTDVVVVSVAICLVTHSRLNGTGPYPRAVHGSTRDDRSSVERMDHAVKWMRPQRAIQEKLRDFPVCNIWKASRFLHLSKSIGGREMENGH